MTHAVPLLLYLALWFAVPAAAALPFRRRRWRAAPAPLSAALLIVVGGLALAPALSAGQVPVESLNWFFSLAGLYAVVSGMLVLIDRGLGAQRPHLPGALFWAFHGGIGALHVGPFMMPLLPPAVLALVSGIGLVVVTLALLATLVCALLALSALLRA